MPRERNPHREQVAERIRRRAELLGLSQVDIANATGVSYRQVGNVMRGVTGMIPLNRPTWERALRWPAGSLSAAYERGILPDPAYGLESDDGEAGEASPSVRLLEEAGVPPVLRTDPIVAEILDGPFEDEQKVHMLRDWSNAKVTNARVLDQLQSVTTRTG